MTAFEKEFRFLIQQVLTTKKTIVLIIPVPGDLIGSLETYHFVTGLVA